MAAERGSPALLLAVAALLATALLAGIHHGTRERIAAREHTRALERLAAVLPPSLYDNDPLADTALVHDARLGPGARTVWRARRGGIGTAVALTVTAPDGYAGPIELLVGIDRAGHVLGVRVVAHAETPGLGDPIELRRSDWVLGFDGRSLAEPPPPRWTVRRDGGDFDQFTGATITPRAVVTAVARALAVHAERGESLYALPAQPH
ncbi:MAG: electron transport complex subunit RsxG [Xanthomonadales bacterium]|nr:electron transport complex subunit RsxG [Xanthomonadales bacterium]